MFDNIQIVLVNPSHPGNIGAAARAMKAMNFTRLVLVDPVAFPHQEATARASGADDILANAAVVATLPEAIRDSQLVFGTSARERSLPWPLLNPRQCATKVLAESNSQISLVFGRERTGLSNDELALCHYHVHIPTNESFSSLNLAAAVQVLVYELRMSSIDEAHEYPIRRDDELASAEEVHGFYTHLQQTMTELGFLDPNHPKLLMQRLQRLFNRAELERKEVNILRGLLSAVNKR